MSAFVWDVAVLLSQICVAFTRISVNYSVIPTLIEWHTDSTLGMVIWWCPTQYFINICSYKASPGTNICYEVIIVTMQQCSSHKNPVIFYDKAL